MTTEAAAEWLAEVAAEAERQQRQLPAWARPVYVPPIATAPVTSPKEGER